MHVTAIDGHTFSAYLKSPTKTARGSIVVLQELFGVNAHIRSVCDQLAEVGYVAMAPALFDRVQPGLELGYTPEDIQRGLAARNQIALPHVLLDVQAAIDPLRQYGLVGVLGFCWGGTVAFLAAARLHGLGAAVAYYGSMIPEFAAEQPKVPLMLHFGERDHTLPVSSLELIKSQQRSASIWVYPASHGFNCDARPNYDEASAQLALQRTLMFFAEHIG